MNKTRAAIAGVLSVGLALGISELFTGLIDGVPSMITSVGSVFIPFVPPALEDWAIATFGTSDKFVLNMVTLVGTLAFGAWAGRTMWGSPRGAAAIWTGFTAFGLLAAFLQPLTSPVATFLTLAIASGTGFGALHLLRQGDELLHRLETAKANGATIDHAKADAVVDLARRRWLGMLAGVGGAALVAAWTGRSLFSSRVKVDFDAIALPQPIRSAGPVPAGADLAVDGITPIVVEFPDFYRIDTALVVPAIAPDQWSLRIFGMVDQEVELDYADILGMDMVEAYVTLSCVSNEVGGDLVGNAKWLGVPLADLLDRAGVDPASANQLVGRSIDGWTGGFPTELAYQDNALLAVGMNDEVLPAKHGFPARLVIPGLYGYVSATKWITEIELTTWDAFDGYWVPRGWSKEGPIKTQSRFDVPGRSSTVPAGPTVFAGVAWAPTIGVERVEVRVDEGPWQQAELSTPLSDDAWVQWRAEIDLAPGVHLAEVRATDRSGFTQRDRYVSARPDGAEGWDVMRVTAS